MSIQCRLKKLGQPHGDFVVTNLLKQCNLTLKGNLSRRKYPGGNPFLGKGKTHRSVAAVAAPSGVERPYEPRRLVRCGPGRVGDPAEAEEGRAGVVEHAKRSLNPP